ncbi:uroporphyrin-III C-methyltransferase [Pseudogymnoascus australis]
MRTSLLTAIDATSHVHLIIGTNALAASRCAKSLEVGATPIVIFHLDDWEHEVHPALQQRIDDKEVKWLPKPYHDDDISTLGRPELNNYVDAVFVTLTPRDPLSLHISTHCKRHRVPINVVDAPSLCTFSLLSTHTDGPLQIGITTNGKGCKLSSRIRRDIASSLPPNLGAACHRLGTIRQRIQAEDHAAQSAAAAATDEDDSGEQSATFNALVREADREAAKGRRMRWLSQICEYWPLSRLADVTDADIEAVMTAYTSAPSASPSLASTSTITTSTTSPSLPAPPPPPSKKGLIILAGSGPGHPDLLTRATHRALHSATLILADKLVPSPVLALIPRRTPLHIARKFPGNAERAQDELMALALAGLRRGETVLRLKQGDPYLYGRGGEEVEFFRKEGWGDRIVVLPGITSAFSAPLFAGVPATQRGVADQVLVCTGTGRKGVPTRPPAYVGSQTVVFLMALHRIGGLVGDLTTWGPEEGGEGEHASAGDGEAVGGAAATTATTAGSESDGKLERKTHTRALWPLSTPCAVIERASCPDQRVIRTTLAHVVAAIESEGSRPPGLLVLGKACEALWTPVEGKRW